MSKDRIPTIREQSSTIAARTEELRSAITEVIRILTALRDDFSKIEGSIVKDDEIPGKVRYPIFRRIERIRPALAVVLRTFKKSGDLMNQLGYFVDDLNQKLSDIEKNRK